MIRCFNLLVSLGWFLISLSPALQDSAQTREDTERALMAIKLLAPSAFPGLPTAFQKQLEARGCRIPQVEYDPPGKPNNVIRGEFARKGQTDWAALCSQSGKSFIIVYWSKPTTCPANLATLDDSLRLQGNANGRIVYSRQLTPSGRKEILEYLPTGGASSAPPDYPVLDHQGIEDAFVGKASEVYFCSNGKWRTLEGAD
jgi:hypothetical protein